MMGEDRWQREERKPRLMGVAGVTNTPTAEDARRGGTAEAAAADGAAEDEAAGDGVAVAAAEEEREIARCDWRMGKLKLKLIV